MKTIIWKELRENWKWAALALLCLALAKIGTLHQQRDDENNMFYGLTLCSSSFLLVTSFGCAIVGAALGAVQILPELRRDQWAALLHRPVSRRTIFLGKAIAGLLLYFLATALPLLAAVIYVATPGQFAGPLVPGMIYPAASDVALGMVFYFAALLVSLFRGPWYGRRALLALAVVPVFVLHLATSWGFLLPIIASAILMTAAGAVMEGNGQVKDRTVIGRYCFLLVLFLGVGTGLIFLSMGISLLPGGTDHSVYSYQHFVVTKDGRVLMGSERGDGSAISLTDMDGKPVTDERYIGNDSRGTFCPNMTLGWDLTEGNSYRQPYLMRYPRNLQNYVLGANANSYGSAEYWYLLVQKNYFVGYDKLSHRCIGICDREGFHPAGTAPKPFPIGLRIGDYNSNPYFYFSGGQLYAFDFSERTMKLLITVPNGDVYGAVGAQAEPGKTAFIGVAWEKGIEFLQPDGTAIVSIPYGHDLAIWSNIALAVTPDEKRIFVEYERGFRDIEAHPERKAVPAFVDEIDLQGKVVNSYRMVIEPQAARHGWAERVTAVALPPVPVGLYVAHTLQAKNEVPEYPIFVASPGMEHWRRLLITAFSCGALLAVVTFFWARRAGFAAARAWRWAIFVFCLGLPGFLTVRLGAGWPTRVPCPQCARRRSIAADECQECHQTWPTPESNGTEIFEPVAD